MLRRALHALRGPIRSYAESHSGAVRMWAPRPFRYTTHIIRGPMGLPTEGPNGVVRMWASR
eukprot:3429276-Pyramimonas_sp.AAC.1